VVEQNTPQPMDVAGECFMYDEYKKETSKRRNLMLTWIIIILLVLWLLGYFGPNISSSFPRTGNAVHTLLVIAVILILLRLLGII
jgi:lipopolysaccharide export LptBFGC system permease protein LptF